MCVEKLYSNYQPTYTYIEAPLDQWRMSGEYNEQSSIYQVNLMIIIQHKRIFDLNTWDILFIIIINYYININIL